MLVFTRKKGEGVVFSVGGSEVTVNVFGIGKHKIKLSISAPKNVMVIRSELRETENENAEASKSVDKSAIEALIKANKQ